MKKLWLIGGLLFLSLTLVACSSGVSGSKKTANDVVEAFKNAGLEAEDARNMTAEDYGIAPMKAKEAMRFFIPSLGENAGGRIFLYDKKADLEEMKNYYDELGRTSALFFSWTITKDNILIQISGNLPEEKYNEYKAALESIK